MIDGFLVTGAGGMVGGELVRLLTAQRRPVLGLTRGQLDVTDPEAVRDAVSGWAAGTTGSRAVLNAAGWTDVDGAESAPEAAARVNRDGPAHLAAACADTGSLLVQVSTNYVFDGAATSPYEESARPAPLNEYGRGKAAGELAVWSAVSTAYVVRTAWVYAAAARNFVTTVARLAAGSGPVEMVDDQWGSPTWARHLAAGLVALADSGAAYGTYHCCGGGATTWFGLAQAVFEELGADPGRLRPVPTAGAARSARRPRYAVLSDAGWRAAGLRPLADWRSALHEAIAGIADAVPDDGPLSRPRGGTPAG